MQVKLELVRQIFPKQKARVFASSDYGDFFKRCNRHWLEPYAVFCVLRDRFGTADFTSSGRRIAFTGGMRSNSCWRANDPAAREEVRLNYFIQFHLHWQLQEAAKYAHANGVILKGDIAVGVYRHSVDVWQQPELFHTDMQAGAPPDPFAAKGQNWGFPTYNWGRDETG